MDIEILKDKSTYAVQKANFRLDVWKYYELSMMIGSPEYVDS